MIMNSFSAGLKLTNLDDFINPSQECVKPVKIDKALGQTSKIIIQEDGQYTGITDTGQEYRLEKVNITLNDCLACSGCITSAESVLVEQQSSAKFLAFLEENKAKPEQEKHFVVVSVAPQSRASLAARFQLSIEETARRLTAFFKHLGADLVLDIGFARDLALLETYQEFLQRLQNPSADAPLPMLASNCPGWVCYAEKTQGAWVLPHISRVRSAQQIMGALVKLHLPSLVERDPQRIHHVSIAPCFDKKLESSREEFGDDVDLVLATNEVEQLLISHADVVASLPDSPLDPIYSTVNDDGRIVNNDKSGSDGYLPFILSSAPTELFADQGTEIVTTKGRNKDLSEVTLQSSSSSPLLTLGYSLGFRNIQTTLRQLKRGRPLHFVEVMACPSGCLNGGGQSRGVEAPILAAVQKIYADQPDRRPEGNCEARNVLRALEAQGLRDRVLRASYAAVQKVEIVTKLATDW